MAYKMLIKYAAKDFDPKRMPAPICALFMPTNAAADMDAFDETYYDTNVPRCADYGDEMDQFLAMQVSHPGLIAAMKNAVEAKDHAFTMLTDDPNMATMVPELNRAMAEAGFTFEWQGKE